MSAGDRSGRHDGARDLEHDARADSEADDQHVAILAGGRAELHDHLEHDRCDILEPCLHGVGYWLHGQRSAGGQRLASSDSAVRLGR
jgi:hypothetical protein